jgi:hypothetical protein|tara:strand:- start:3468 stop:3824 length:357 start_codon:yes stop_codon:yes gene_type:complete
MSALIESFKSSAVFIPGNLRCPEREVMFRFESFVLRLTIDDEIGLIDGQITHVGSQTTSYFKGLASLEKLLLDRLEVSQLSSHDGPLNGKTTSPTNLGRTRHTQGDHEESSLDGPLAP